MKLIITQSKTVVQARSFAELLEQAWHHYVEVNFWHVVAKEMESAFEEVLP